MQESMPISHAAKMETHGKLWRESVRMEGSFPLRVAIYTSKREHQSRRQEGCPESDLSISLTL